MAKANTTWRLNISIPRTDINLIVESQNGQYDLQDKTLGRKIIRRMLWVIEKGDFTVGYFDKNELRAMAEGTVKIILDDPDHIDKIHQQTIQHNRVHFKLAAKIRKMDLSKLPNSQLLKLQQKLYRAQYLSHCWSQPTTWFVDSDGEDYSRYLFNLIQSKIKPQMKLDTATVFSVLTTPARKTMAQQEEEESLKLVQLIRRNKKLKQWFTSNPTRKLVAEFATIPMSTRNKLYDHYYKWRWVPYTYIGPAYDLDYYLEVWRGLLREGIDPQAELRTKAVKAKKVQAERKKLIRILALTPYQKHLFDIAADIVWLKGFRKDCYFHGFFVLDIVLGELARRSGLTLMQAKYLLKEELPLLFKGRSKQLAKTASERWKYSIYYFDDGKQTVMTGSKAKAFFKRQTIEKIKIEKTGELRGMCACPGVAQGTVRVINAPEDMPKMKTGDIMIAHATYPSLVPAMKKAAAIITEEGGITCHAAIVSRELQTPCIVGVRGLLQALKDGDKVIVDATKGVIKVK